MNIKIYISNTKRVVISEDTLFTANDYDEMCNVLREELNKVRKGEYSYCWFDNGSSDCCYNNAEEFESDVEDMIHKAVKFVKKHESCNCVFFCDYENDTHKTVSILID